MSAKDFILGFFISLSVGVPLAFYNPLIAVLLATTLGSVVAASKKEGVLWDSLHRQRFFYRLI